MQSQPQPQHIDMPSQPPAQSDFESLLTPADVATRLKIPVNSVKHLLRNGDLHGIKIGKHWRIHPKEVKRITDLAESALAKREA